MKEIFESYLADVRYKDWETRVRMDGARPYLQVGFWDADLTRDCGEKTYQSCRKWFLSPHMTKSEVIQTAFKAILGAEEHEARERFTYRGQAIFGPHFHVDTLAEACLKKPLDLRAPTAAAEAA